MAGSARAARETATPRIGRDRGVALFLQPPCRAGTLPARHMAGTMGPPGRTPRRVSGRSFRSRTLSGWPRTRALPTALLSREGQRRGAREVRSSTLSLLTQTFCVAALAGSARGVGLPGVYTAPGPVEFGTPRFFCHGGRARVLACKTPILSSRDASADAAASAGDLARARQGALTVSCESRGATSRRRAWHGVRTIDRVRCFTERQGPGGGGSWILS